MAESRLVSSTLSAVDLDAVELVTPRGTPDATVARLPGYLRALAEFAETGVATVSSGALAQASGVGPAQLRKDLSYLGSYGSSRSVVNSVRPNCGR